MKRTIIYARVSSDEQAKIGKTSLATQTKACREYEQLNGFVNVIELAEDFTGTVPLEQRPEGGKAYAMLKNGDADALIVYRMDRLVRPPDEGDEWNIPVLVRSLAGLGKEIHTCNRGRIGTSFPDLLIAMLDAKSAGDERRAMIDRLRRGHLAKARAGKVPGKGRHLFGYRHGDGQYIIYEGEAKIVREVFGLYVNGAVGDEAGVGADGGHSLKDIARTMSARGEPTPADAYGIARRRHRAGTWHVGTVHRMIISRAYMGEWRYHDTDTGEVIVIPVPAIVPKSVWLRAQAKLAVNREYAFRNSAPDKYLLRGMVRCSRCGKVFIGCEKGKGIEYYKPNCSGGLPSSGCHERLVRASLAEEAAWEYVLHIAIGDDLEAALMEIVSQSSQLESERQDRLYKLGRDLESAEAEADQLADMLGSTSGAVGAALQRKIDVLNDRHAGLVKQQQKLSQSKAGTSEDDISAYLVLGRNLERGIENATRTTKRDKFREIQLTITVKDGQATITSIFPVVMSNIDLHPRK